jgi:hypothetical protein
VLSIDHSQQDHHDSDHQKNVYETTHGVGSDQAKQPQDEHNDGNGIEHDSDLSIKYFRITAAPATIRAEAAKELQLDQASHFPKILSVRERTVKSPVFAVINAQATRRPV